MDICKPSILLNVIQPTKQGDRKDEETGPSVIHHSLNQLVKAWRSKLRYNYSVENVPTLRIAEFLQADKPFDLQGPLLKPGSGDKQNYDTKVRTLF